MRARAYITADAREQTAWGTARAYVAVGVATADTGSALTPSILGFNRAFIQWAGITAGITQSFFDFYSGAATGYRAYLPTKIPATPVGGCGLIPRNSATACRRRSRPNNAGPRRSLT